MADKPVLVMTDSRTHMQKLMGNCIDIGLLQLTQETMSCFSEPINFVCQITSNFASESDLATAIGLEAAGEIAQRLQVFNMSFEKRE